MNRTGSVGRHRAALASARVARLATVRPDGRPHLVPVTFALLDDGHLVTAVDHKPKRTRELQRLRNVAAEPRVSLLVDHYAEDWSLLWWVRVDGTAEVVTEEPRRSELTGPLSAKYEQYAGTPPRGPVVLVAVTAVASWAG